MFATKTDNVTPWMNTMNQLKTKLQERVQASLAEIRNKMKEHNIQELSIYFPTEKNLAPSFQDFMIVFFHNNHISQMAHVQAFKAYLQAKLLEENFHCWVGSEQELISHSSKLMKSDYLYEGDFFKDIFLKNLQTLNEFLSDKACDNTASPSKPSAE